MRLFEGEETIRHTPYYGLINREALKQELKNIFNSINHLNSTSTIKTSYKMTTIGNM